MSATLPPNADCDRASDFGEFWGQAAPAPTAPSLLPEPEIVLQPLTPEQRARRLRLRRAVGGVVLGLLAFTTLAVCVYVMKAQRSASSSSSSSGTSAQPVAKASPVAPERSPVPSSPADPEPVTTAPASESDRALALAQTPVATLENFQTWSRLALQLSPADRREAEHHLSRLSVTGARPLQEAARLELALLWRASARRAKAQKVLVSLARTASDPLVKRFALDTLSSA